MQLRLAHRAFEAKQQPVVEGGRMVDAIAIADQRVGEAGEVDEPMPIGVVAREPRYLKAKHKADATKQAARSAEIEELTRTKTKPHEDQFVRLFANSAGQPQNDFFATADQVLYFENAGSVRSWTQPSGNNLAARLAKLTDPAALTRELYLAVLTRVPSDDEAKDIASLLGSRPPEQRNTALSDAIWALLTSTEFRFRH